MSASRIPNENDDRGAVAVLVAILAIFLIGLSAFTVDMGAAYVSNRNLQKAADAGALAGAQALTTYPGTCDAVRSNSAAVAAAHQAAIAMAKKNYPDASWVEDATWSVKCDPKLKVLLVTFGNSGTTKTNFTGLFKGPKAVTTNRGAEATVDVAPGAKEGMRPLALCSASFDPAYMDRSGDFVRIHFPGAGRVPPASCNVSLSGNWWLLDCPGERTGSASELVNQIVQGCKEPVSVIPGQTNATTPGQLTVVLETACPSAPAYSETCMSGQPGNITQGQTSQAFVDLMATGQPSLYPVFCAPIDCSAVTANGNGTNAVYPVYKLVSAIMCGFHFDKNRKADSTHASCAGNPYSTAGDASDNNYFVFKFINYRTSGNNAESDCALGAKCDGGLRRTRLTG